MISEFANVASQLPTLELPFAELVIGSPGWIIPTIVLGTLLTSLILWNYSRNVASPSATLILGAFLKIAAVALLAVCLLQPMRRDQRPRPRANLLPVVVDTSQSMDLALGKSTESWRDRIDQQLEPTSTTLASLSESFDTRIYGFDKRLSSVASIDQLRRDGSSSRLAQNLEELSIRLQGRPVAGVVVMTDGNESLPEEEASSWAEYPYPVYPVVPRKSVVPSDLRITGTSIQQTNFEISPVTITVRYGITGMMTGDAFATITDVETDSIVAEQSISLDEANEDRSVVMRFRPSDVGLRFYRVDVFREVDREAMGKPDQLLDATSSEATLVNNTRLIAVDRRSGPYRVLYVSGRPNWEFKFLRRAVSTDAEIELRGLVRMANKKPKFSFRDRGVSSTNPLFQGLGEDEEETAEQYDEPVMIALGYEGGEDVVSSFPKTEDELFKFDALILDDIETTFFSPDQLTMLRRFVSVRGGGLLMLGGAEMFTGRKFSESQLGELSPVYASRFGQEPAGDHVLSLTREGMLQPWLRLRDSAVEETNRLRSMPAFLAVNSVGELKPGAFRYATTSTGDGKQRTAIAAHRFGKGKVGAILLTDVWRWFLRRDEKSKDDPSQAWRQTVRWLVAEVPTRASIQANESVKDTDVINVRIDSLDDSYSPMDDSIVKATVRSPNGKPIELDGKPMGAIPGAFGFEYFSDAPGSYRVIAEVREPDGSLVGTPETGWARQLAGREFDQLEVNLPLLEKIAQQTGGQVVSEDKMDELQRKLSATKVPVMETWVYPLWHQGWVITLALACLCLEWGLRRWGGLA